MTITKMIGTVRVMFCTLRPPTVVAANITSGMSATSSLASVLSL